MAPQDTITTIASTPNQIAQNIASAKGDAVFTSGKVTIAILVHNEDNDILVHNDFDLSASASLAVTHFPTHYVGLQPFAADEDADISLKSLTEDAITSMLGPVEVENMTVLCTVGTISTTKGAEIFAFVATQVDSSHVPDVLISDMQWLPEASLQKVDLRAIVSQLGGDSVGNLLRARAAWKEDLDSSLDSVPDLVRSLPSASSATVPKAGSTFWDGDIESSEDTGYEPDAESSTDTDSTLDAIDHDQDRSHARVEDLLDDLEDAVEGVVYGNEYSNGKGAAKQSERQHYNSVFGVKMTDDDEVDEKYDTSKPIGRRTFQPDPAITRGCRQPRKQQKNPPLMVDPSYHWAGPRFALPAQKVDGRRFVTKLNKTGISMATDKAVTKGKLMWEDLPKVASETRLVRRV
ncbi:hypothetical protein CKM354_000799500 [Cercospora kikuchii]|uniref:Uncharacterized protein n=1 Tax=Cercospora kikuchii TaxID=84275 RepID=A0A9P3FEV0_9PEZI|nr:uncharacterized protein CKM354_000799500 [Cercospora kikuchii]GIZ44808.1 hypothetical protein CKM354_000799500 [Cercospora kikuchii]